MKFTCVNAAKVICEPAPVAQIGVGFELMFHVIDVTPGSVIFPPLYAYRLTFVRPVTRFAVNAPEFVTDIVAPVVDVVLVNTGAANTAEFCTRTDESASVVRLGNVTTAEPFTSMVVFAFVMDANSGATTEPPVMDINVLAAAVTLGTVNVPALLMREFVKLVSPGNVSDVPVFTVTPSPEFARSKLAVIVPPVCSHKL